jgi:serpin B
VDLSVHSQWQAYVRVREFWLPRFKLSFSGEMNDVLKAMGVKAAFDKDTVNLSGMLHESRTGGGAGLPQGRH